MLVNSSSPHGIPDLRCRGASCRLSKRMLRPKRLPAYEKIELHPMPLDLSKDVQSVPPLTAPCWRGAEGIRMFEGLTWSILIFCSLLC